MAARNPERNAAIVAARNSGKTYKVIAHEFSISTDRARKIYEREAGHVQVWQGEVLPRRPTKQQMRAIVEQVAVEFKFPITTLRFARATGGDPKYTHDHTLRDARRKAAGLLYLAGAGSRNIGALLGVSTNAAAKLARLYLVQPTPKG